MSHEVYVHYLNGGPFDGDHTPNGRPWKRLVVTKACEKHKDPWEYAETETCDDCKKHEYVQYEPDEFREADCPGLEVITQDGVDQAPIIHRVDMKYNGVLNETGE